MWFDNVLVQTIVQTGKDYQVNSGNCTCQAGQEQIEILIQTDDKPDDFTWRLVRSNGTIVLESDSYEEENSEYQVDRCVSVAVNECLRPLLFDYYRDGDTDYSVSWQGGVIKNGTITGAFDIISIGTCIKSCPQNDSFFELELFADAITDVFSWNLSLGDSIIFSEDVFENEQFYDFRSCLSTPENGCMSLLLFRKFDSKYSDNSDPGEHYAVMWNNEGIVYNNTIEPINIIKMPIRCNFTLCGQGESFFEVHIYIGTDDKYEGFK